MELLAGDGPLVEISVFGMACSYCQDTVETVLEDLEAVRSADVNLETGRARVRVEPGLESELLIETVKSVGYEARLA